MDLPAMDVSQESGEVEETDVKPHVFGSKKRRIVSEGEADSSAANQSGPQDVFVPPWSITNSTLLDHPVLDVEFLSNILPPSETKLSSLLSAEALRSAFAVDFTGFLRHGMEMFKRFSSQQEKEKKLEKEISTLKLSLQQSEERCKALVMSNNKHKKVEAALRRKNTSQIQTGEDLVSTKDHVVKLEKEMSVVRAECESLRDSLRLVESGNQVLVSELGKMKISEKNLVGLVEKLNKEKEILIKEIDDCQDGMRWLMKDGVPMMVSRLFRSKEFVLARKPIHSVLIKYGSQLGIQCGRDMFSPNTPNEKLPGFDADLNDKFKQAYRDFECTKWRYLEELSSMSLDDLRARLMDQGVVSGSAQPDQP